MSSLMAVTDRIFISTQQDIQLLDFILKQKSSEAIIALITASTSFDFAVTRSSFRLIRMFLTYSSSEVLDCSLIDKVTGVDTFLVNKYVINVLSSDKELQSEYRKSE
jgi:hypothetical protein